MAVASAFFPWFWGSHLERGCRIGLRENSFLCQTPRVEPWLYHLLTLWPWASHLTFFASFFFFLKEFLHFYYLFIYFIYFWLCWVFVSVQGLSLVVASGGHSSLRCTGLSLSWPLLLRSTSSRRAGSVVVAHGPGCSAACGIFPDQGSNPCPLHWQADSQPLRHQGSPLCLIFNNNSVYLIGLWWGLNELI